MIPPTPINKYYNLEIFDCGDAELNKWLKEKAILNEGEASRTYLVASNEKVVIAYYSLAYGSIRREIAISKVKRNMPDPIPAMLVGRLAVDTKWHGTGLGRGMLRDTVIRTLDASKVAGLRALFVHAISPEAKAFYSKCGFSPFPINSMTLMITVKEVRSALLG
ncbi:MAG: GNAT family N-acetyltransferase [Nitrospiria bacterium]